MTTATSLGAGDLCGEYSNNPNAALFERLESQNLSTLNQHTLEYDSQFPTDDVHADKLGAALQKHGFYLRSLKLNYRNWTKWGAHEIAAYLEETECLETLVLKHYARGSHSHHNSQSTTREEHNDQTNEDAFLGTMSSTRTLACLLEALALNQNGSIRKLGFQAVALEGKSVSPFCQLLNSTTSIQEITIHGSFVADMESEYSLERIATAFQGNKSLTKIIFSDVPRPFLTFLLSQLAVESPLTLKAILFQKETLGEAMDLDTTGLEALLKSAECRIQHLKFSNTHLDSENTEALLRGLLENTTVERMEVAPLCSFDEEVMGRILSESTCLRRIQLCCTTLQEPTFDGIRALQNNTSIVECELTGLKESCGAALREVLTHNRTIQSLTLDARHYFTAQEEVYEAVSADDIRLLAEGLRLNRQVNKVCFQNLKIGDQDCLQFVAQALCPVVPDNEPLHPVYSLIDLSINHDEIVDVGLLPFSQVMRLPHCRLRSFRFALLPNRSHSGLSSLLQALEENQSVEVLQIESPRGADIRYLGDWSIIQTFAKSLPKMRSLKRLELDFGMDIESRFNPRGFLTIREDLLTALAANSCLEQLQFGNELYRTRTPREKGEKVACWSPLLHNVLCL